MSAIAGIWSYDGAIDAAESCGRMMRALSIYGPDDIVRYNGGSVALGRCLLPLLPEDRFDHQPLSAGSVTALVADVRLDNRFELAQKLNLSGPQSDCMADSSMLLSAWQRWGEGCLDHLSGAFTFAIWNDRERHLFLARDHTGERPLFYASSGSCFAFASMPKGLHPLPFVGAEVDEEYVACYLSLVFMPLEQTIFQRIQRLPAGSAMSIRERETRVWKHWRPAPLSIPAQSSDDEYLGRFREIFDRAVAARLRTTGGVGAELSGGLDSSAVAATAAGMLANQSREMICYTAVPRSDFHAAPSSTHFYDEGPAAAEVAAFYPNMRHVLVRSGDTPFLDILDWNNMLYDHPCFGPSNEVWSNAIMTRAHESGVTVLLNGNCGNSTMSYDGLPALSVWLRSARWITLARIAARLRRSGSASIRAILRHAVGPSLPFWLRQRVDPHMRGFSLDYSMLRPEISRRLDLKRRAFHDLNAITPDGRVMLTTLLTYGDISETGIASQGGWKLDFRDPTFDRNVVEFCLAVPLQQFLCGGRLRSLARRAMAGRLPNTTLTRQQRGRQSADWHANLSQIRERMAAQVDLLDRSPLARRMLDLERMRLLIRNWPTTGLDTPEVAQAYHIALTRGFSVGSFLRHYDPEAT